MKPALFVFLLCVTHSGYSQSSDSVLIRGQAISKDNHPLPGVTVRIANSDKMAFSDISGNFELWTPIESIVEFSCISEPYRISVSSIGVPKEDEIIKFEFDLKQPYSDYRTKKNKGRTVKVNPGRISDIILAYYNSDFERITQKHYEYHHNLNHKMMFMIDGQVMDNGFTLNRLDYNSINDIAILRIIDSNDKIIFMISTKKMNRSDPD
jgi:hypothetical protein